MAPAYTSATLNQSLGAGLGDAGVDLGGSDADPLGAVGGRASEGPSPIQTYPYRRRARLAKGSTVPIAVRRSQARPDE